MPVTLVPYEPDHAEAVRRLNQRLRGRGFSGTVLPETVPGLAVAADLGLDLAYLVAVDPEGEVRGGYVLRSYPFRFSDGSICAVGTFQVPVSEGVVDRKQAAVAAHLLLDALRRQPLLYTLGIGGASEPLAKLLAGAGWSLESVPFLFRVLRPSQFLRHIAYLRRTRARRLGLDLLATLRLAELPLRLGHRLLDRSDRYEPKARREIVPRFDSWADEVWAAAASQFSLIAVRDRQRLDLLYPATDRRTTRLRVSLGGQVVGWSVLMCNRVSGHHQFGDMLLGSIVDALAMPGHEELVIAHALDALRHLGADLVVSNQSHRAFRVACRRCGFLPGPSNFLFAASQQLVRQLDGANGWRHTFQMTRGDGDGPINL